MAIITRTFLGLKVSYNNGDTNYNPSSSVQYDIEFTSDTDNDGAKDGDLLLDYEGGPGLFDTDTKVIVDGVVLDFAVLTISTHDPTEQFPGTDVVIFEVTFPGDSKATRISIYPELTNAEVGTIGNGRTDLTSAPPPSPPTYSGVCFVAGTPIETEAGVMPVEDLVTGDRCRVLDDGRLAQIQWRGETVIGVAAQLADPALRSVRIRSDVAGMPDLRVSPQHRIALAHPELELLFWHPRMFIPAHWLIGTGHAVLEAPTAPLHYVHLLFAYHEILPVCGRMAESLYLGPEVKDWADPVMREELEIAFPDFAAPDFAADVPLACPMMTRTEFRVLRERRPDVLAAALGLGAGAFAAA